MAAECETIKRLNDKFRETFQGGKVVVTPGIQALPPLDQAKIFSMVRTFNKFSPDNDPHGEHDFGIVKLGDESIYFEIDYYDNELQGGSEDPADPAQTTRVMTIMFAHEY